jgi:predicted permease
MNVLAGLFPVFAILAIGVVARRLRIIDEAAAHGLNRLVANLALPALFVIKVGTSPLEAALSGRLVVVTSGVVLGTGVLALVLAEVVRLPKPQRGVFSQAAMRGNLAYVAFPVILAALGKTGFQQAVVTSAVVIPLMNLLAVGVLEVYRGTHGGSARIVLRVLANPMVIGALAGLVLSAVGWQPWEWLGRTLTILSDFALPGALLALGAQLEVGRWRAMWRPTSGAVLFKLVAAPAAGWWLLHMLGASPAETAVGVLLLAAPTAVASYPVAADLGGDIDLAGACLLATTVASFVTYPAWSLLVVR